MLPEWKYATPAQEVYIKKLYNKCFSARIKIDYNPILKKRMLKSEASSAIEMLLRCIKENKGE